MSDLLGLGDGLNAAAASFTPGAGFAAPPQHKEAPLLYATEEDDALMDEINAEIEAQQDELPPHAEEFWFPECRNCKCCNGYKYGCGCCITKGIRICSCTSGGNTMGTPTALTTRQGGSGGNVKKLCRFYTSPGGCRFGESCRFAHA